MINCFCGNNLTYNNCCELLHNGKKSAETAEELMRSRYSAFATANGNYLINSNASKTRDVTSIAETEKWAKSVKWIKLEIINTLNGEPGDTTGIVEFKAHYKYKIFKRSIHERSTFVIENDKWVYLNGEHF